LLDSLLQEIQPSVIQDVKDYNREYQLQRREISDEAICLCRHDNQKCHQRDL